MKFFRNNTHLILRLFVNQIGITFFALVLSMAVVSLDKPVFKLVVSIFSILFYLCLIYSVMWEAGASNAVRIESGRMEKTPFFALKAALWASVPNLFLGVLMTVFALIGVLGGVAWAAEGYGVMHIICGLFEAMFAGLFSAIIGPLSGTAKYMVVCILYLLSSLPMILVSIGSYELGKRNIASLGKVRPKKNG